MDGLDPRVMPEPNTGCWLWLGYLQDGDYAQIGRNTLVHRVNYAERHGSIPHGHHVHHTCETRCCVNPSHLRVLAPGERLHETLRLNGDDYLWQNRARPERCPHNHSLADAYFFPSRPTRRVCRECVRIRNAQRAKETS